MWQDVRPYCRSCGAKLGLEEMHYYHKGDGTATCEQCEQKWLDAIEEWRHQDHDDQTPMPEKP